MKNKIGKLLNKARTDNKMSLQQVADMCNVSKSTVSCWERGINIPAGDILIKLAKKLDFMEELAADDPEDEDVILEEYEKIKANIAEINHKLSFLPIPKDIPEFKDNKVDSAGIKNLEKKISKIEKSVSSLSERLKQFQEMLTDSDMQRMHDFWKSIDPTQFQTFLKAIQNSKEVDQLKQKVNQIEQNINYNKGDIVLNAGDSKKT